MVHTIVIFCLLFILAFETSCDDTSVALLKDWMLISISTRTQIEHTIPWWVVPEVAARLHANAIFPCIFDVLKDWNISIDEVDYIACTSYPWLLPSLLTGMTVAKTLADAIQKPIIWVNHIEGHIFANFLDRSPDDIIFPWIVLTVSWWHNELYIWRSLFEMERIWETIDDASWEAFDKVAKMMWFWFPGGPIVSKLASNYIGSYEWIFPLVLLEKDSLNFSFSGLKTAVKREIDKGLMSFEKIAFEFEQTVVRILTKKLFLAAKQYNISYLYLAWWVSSNNILKEFISSSWWELGYKTLFPVKSIYSQDNAAMIAIRAYYEIISRGVGK